MTLPPPAAGEPSACVDELRALRASVDRLAQQLGGLAAENAELRRQLAHSETARHDLAAQADHLIDLLGKARTELRQRTTRSD